MNLKKDTLKYVLLAASAFFLLAIKPMLLLLVFLFLLPGFAITLLVGKKYTNVLELGMDAFLWGNLFFFAYYFFVLFQVPIHPIVLWCLQVILPLVVCIIFRKRIHIPIKDTPLEQVTLLLCILLFVLFVYSPLVVQKEITLTDSLLESYMGIHVQQMIQEEHRLFGWNTYQLIGYPTYQYETFLGHFKLGITDALLSFADAVQVNKAIILLHLLFFFIFLGMLLIRIGFSFFPSLGAITILAVFSSYMHAVSHGQYRHTIAIALLPVLIYYFIEMLSDKKRMPLFFVTGFFLFMHHPVIAAVPLVILAITYIFLKLAQCKTLNLREIRNMALGAVCFLVAVLFWVLPFLQLKEWMNEHIAGGSFSAINFFRSEVLASQSLSQLLMYVLLLAGLALFLYKFFWTIKQKEAIQSEQRFLFALLCALLVFVGLYYIPFAQFFMKFMIPYFGRVSKTIALFIVLYIAYAFTADAFVPSLKKYVRMASIAFVAILVLFIAIAARAEIKGTVTESIMQNQIILDAAQHMKSMEPGRFVDYGIYTTVADSAILIMSGKPTVGYGLHQAQHTDLYLKIREVGAGTVPQGTTGTYLLNMLRTSGTRYVFVFTCDPSRGGKELSLALSQIFSVAYQNNCVVIFEDKNNTFVETTPFVNTALSEKEYYNMPYAYRAQPVSFSSFIIGAEDLTAMDEPKAVAYVRDNEEMITIQAPPQKTYLHVKEEYFPKWHAYQDDKEIGVSPTMFGMMLVNSESTKPIIIRYENYWYEKILFLVALGMLIGSIVILRRLEQIPKDNPQVSPAVSP